MNRKTLAIGFAVVVVLGIVGGALIVYQPTGDDGPTTTPNGPTATPDNSEPTPGENALETIDTDDYAQFAGAVVETENGTESFFVRDATSATRFTLEKYASENSETRLISGNGTAKSGDATQFHALHQARLGYVTAKYDDGRSMQTFYNEENINCSKPARFVTSVDRLVVREDGTYTGFDSESVGTTIGAAVIEDTSLDKRLTEDSDNEAMDIGLATRVIPSDGMRTEVRIFVTVDLCKN